jgi:hypothetical protein
MRCRIHIPKWVHCSILQHTPRVTLGVPVTRCFYITSYLLPWFRNQICCRMITPKYSTSEKAETMFWFIVHRGRALAQAVSHRLSTTVARVRAQFRSCGICGGQSGTGADFLLVLRFPLPIFISPTAPHSSSSITRSWYNRPISSRRTKWTVSPHPKKLKKELLYIAHVPL